MMQLDEAKTVKCSIDRVLLANWALSDGQVARLADGSMRLAELLTEPSSALVLLREPLGDTDEVQ